MPPRAIGQHIFDAPPAIVWTAALDAIRASGGHLKKRDDGNHTATAHFGSLLLTWGEGLTLDVTVADGHRTVVTVESTSVPPWALIDFGRNKRNVARVLDQLRSGLTNDDASSY